MHSPIVAVMVALPCCFACSDPQPSRVKVDFALAFEAPRPHTVAVRVSNARTLYAEPEPVLTERDIKSARVGLGSDGKVVLFIQFGTEGSRTLQRVSGANVGDYLVVSLDKTPIVAPRIAAPITDGMAKLEGLPHPEEELRALASRMSGW